MKYELFSIIILIYIHIEISTWGGNTTSLDILVRPDFRSHVAETLVNSGIDYQVIITDIQRAIDDENPSPSEEEEELANRNGM